LNLFFVFLVSGLWHGANVTFIVWGALHGLYLIGERLVFPVSASAQRPLIRLFRWAVTFHLVLLSWVFFRADNIKSAVGIVERILFNHGPLFFDPILYQGLLVIIVLFALDAFTRTTNYWNSLDRFPVWLRMSHVMFLLFGIVLLGVEHGAQFIYFQF
jgi:hypothetical protein